MRATEPGHTGAIAPPARPKGGRPAAAINAHKSLCYWLSRWLWAVCAVLALVASPAEAAPRKRAILVLVQGMPAEWFFSSRDPILAQCGLGLMNAQSPTPVDVLSSYATVGAGTRVRFNPADPHARRAGLSRAKHELRLAYLGPAKEGPQPWAGRPGILLAPHFEVTEVAPCGPDAVPAARRLLETADVLVVDQPDPLCGPGLAFLGELIPHLDPRNDLVILTSPAPGHKSNGQWDALSGFAIWGEGWAGRGVTSSTTRTQNLVANIDVAPTVLEHLGIPVPTSMDGHPIRPGAPTTLPEVLAFAQDRRAVRALMTPVLLVWGGLALLACIWSVLTLLPRPKTPLWGARLGQILLTVPVCVACAMLLTAAIPGSTTSIATSLVLWSASLTLACTLVARATQHPAPNTQHPTPLLLALTLLTAIILADLYFHFGLLQRNLMSDFPNIGSRFYGIGNEWEGMLLGTTLLLPFLIEELRSKPSAVPPPPSTRLLAVLLWGITLVGVAAPWMGADFGGAVTLTLAYVISAAIFAAPGVDRRRSLRRLLGAVLIAGVLAGGLVVLDMLRPAGSRTHVGELAARALGGDWGPVWEMVGRKVALNVEMALSPYTLGGLLAVAPVLGLCYHKLGRQVKAVLERRPLFRAGLQSVLAGGVAGLLLNDTGVVTWAIATGCGLVALMDALLELQIENCKLQSAN